MIGPALKIVAKVAGEAAKKIPLWKELLAAAGGAAATAAGAKIIDKICESKKKSVEEKLAELKALRDKGTITKAEYQSARKRVLDSHFT